MKILVLAGGYDQIALIEKLHSKGHYVILLDYYENPPAKDYADSYYQISTLDMAAVLNISEKEKIDLITTACTDQALLTMAYVSEKMGLPSYVDFDTARNVTNKEYMKKVFAEFHIPTAESHIIGSLKDLDKYKYDFPLIIKPVDCNSSKGVRKVYSREELYLAAENALELSRSHTAIAEAFIDGIEISIDIWNDDEGTKILSISETRKMNNHNDFTIFQSIYPVDLSRELEGQIAEIASNICCAFNLKNCPLLIQAIVDGNKISVIEFSARIGGGSKYKLIEYMSGVPILDAYVNRILGNESQIIHPCKSTKKIELDYIYGHPGIYDSLVNFEKYYDRRIIKELFIYKTRRSKIFAHHTSSDRILGFLIEEDTQMLLEQKRKKIIQTTDILDPEGKSIMYKDCFY